MPRFTRLDRCAATALLVATLCGCSTHRPETGEEAIAKAARLGFWKPHLLLVSDVRHRRLEVEIDWVEGAKPTKSEVAALAEAFRLGCSKPGGIEVRLDDAIPEAEAKGMMRKTLAELHIDGPQDPDAAFAYFLFYDSRLAGTGPANPIAMRAPYPFVVFVDRRYLRSWTWLPGGRRMGRGMMVHEAAHLLGLTTNRTHGDGLHCTNRFCLLNPTIEYRPWRLVWFGPMVANQQLCSDCLADLAASSDEAPASNLCTKGLYCIRSEPGYHVVSSPGYVFVHTGALEDLDFGALERRRKEHFASSPPDHDGEYYQSGKLDLDTAVKLIPLLRQDPVSGISELADVLQKQLDDAIRTERDGKSDQLDQH